MSTCSIHRNLWLSRAAFGGMVFTAAAICAVPVSAQDATWNAGDGDYNNAANWSPAIVPTGTAFFGNGTPTTVTVPQDIVETTVGGWTVVPGSAGFVFNIENDVTFNGAGIAVDGSGGATLNNNAPLLIFANNSTAGRATINNNSGVIFDDNSSAGNAFIVNNGFAANIDFDANSTAGNATINNNGGSLTFNDQSTAGNAAITNNGFEVVFFNDSTAGNATITNNAELFFLDQSSGGQAQIVTGTSGVTDFSGGSGPTGDNTRATGSIAGAGRYYLGNKQLTVGGNGLSTEVSGVISDCGPTGNDCFLPATGGTLIKTGAGTLTLSGANTYTGPTAVLEGSLIVNGSIVSEMNVDGGILGGTGSVVATTVSSEATLAPGNTIGTLTVNGNLLFAGGTYEVEVNAAGQGDQIVVNGTVNLGVPTLRVLAEGGNYQLRTEYVIIDNDGDDAVTGNFGPVTSNLAFLDPSVILDGGDGNDVVLTLRRNATLFQDLARTLNQLAVAGGLDQFATDDPLFVAALNQTAGGALQVYDALSGEIHATVPGILAQDSRYAREAVLGRLVQASYGKDDALAAGGPQLASLHGGKSLAPPPPESAPFAVWVQGIGAWADYDSDGNAGSADRDLGGFMSGIDGDIGGGWRVGGAFGATFSDVTVNERASSADIDSYHLGGYLGGMVGGLAVRGGGIWTWNSVDTSRAVAFPGFFERQSASYDADTGQLFGEIAYPTQMGGATVEPFGGVAVVSIDTDSFQETGGPSASLRGVDTDQDVGYTTLGLRAATKTQWGATQVTPHITAAWQHAFGDVTPGASLAFATNGIGFGFEGVPLAEDSLLLDAGLEFAFGGNGKANVSYSGQFGDGITDNAVKGRATWLF